MNTIKKICLSIIFVAAVGGLLVAPVPASADHNDAHTIDQLTKLIAQLQAQIVALTRHLPSTPPTQGVCPVLTYNLYLGHSDRQTESQVTALQKFLAQYPDVYPEALITGYFGPLTEQAVQSFQRKHNIVSSGSPETTGYGVVGPATRAKIRELCGNVLPPPQPPPPEPHPSLRVLSPNGGETWQIGSRVQISYSLSIAGRLQAALYKDGQWLTNLTVCNESPCIFDLVKNYGAGQRDVTAGNDYKIRLTHGVYYDPEYAYDDSDAPFSITAPSKPDLTVADIYDDMGKLSVKISNIGNASALGNIGHLYIWIDDQLVWTYSLGTLANQSFLTPGGITIVQPQTLSGSHKIKAYIDPNNVITESNESNNVLEKTVTLGISY